MAVFVAGMAERLRTRAMISSRSAAENAAIAAFGQSLARHSDRQGTGEAVCNELSRTFDVGVRVLIRGANGLETVASCPEDASALGPVDQAAADWAWSHGEITGRDTSTLNAADWQFHPLRTALGTLALVALARADGSAPVPQGRATLLSTLLGQAALAHERLLLEDQLRDVRVLE